MARLSGLCVVVAGAGAIGHVLALRLLDEGARVILADPAPLGANASGVAAGMLAPAFEAALDPLASGHFPLLKAARDLWPALARRLAPFGADLDRSGALWVGDEGSNTAMLQQLADLGAEAELISRAAAEKITPGLFAPAGAVLTPEDWTIEPSAVLAALRAALAAAGGQVRPAAVTAWRGGVAALADGDMAPADILVLATGFLAPGLGLPPPELQRLQPIKGQIVSLEADAPRGGPVVRAEGIYVVPRASGPVAGATMEAGVRDLAIDLEASQRLKAAAAGLFPALARAAATGSAGVRASTPDGLPLVGESRVSGIRLAVGARRNGWLLAPLIAQITADQLAGGDGGDFAALFGPSRF